MVQLDTYTAVRVAVAPALTFLGRKPIVRGLENLPDYPVVLASNHLAVIDPYFLSVYLPRRITYAAKVQYFTGSGLKAHAVRKFMTATGAVPLDRDDTDAALVTLRVLAEVVRSGHTVALFPEGYSSPDGRLFKGKTGPVRVAQMAGVPIVPVALEGTNQVNPPGTPGTYLHRAHVNITIGKPIDTSDSDLRNTTEQLMTSIQRMSGQERAHIYASVIKEPHKHPERRNSTYPRE